MIIAGHRAFNFLMDFFKGLRLSGSKKTRTRVPPARSK